MQRYAQKKGDQVDEPNREEVCRAGTGGGRPRRGRGGACVRPTFARLQRGGFRQSDPCRAGGAVSPPAPRDFSLARVDADPSADDRPARCRLQREREVEAMAGLIVAAARSWSNQAADPLFIRDIAGWPGWIRVDWGDRERVAEVLPGEADAPLEVGREVDLPALERILIGQRCPNHARGRRGPPRSRPGDGGAEVRAGPE